MIQRITVLLLGSLLSGIGASAQIAVQRAFPNITFSQPVDLQHAGDGSDRVFVVEQPGVIKVFPNADTVGTATIFLDIRSRLVSGGELGLLGLAFHPAYRSNGYFYVNYTADNPLRSIIARYSVSASDPDRADSLSEVVLLTVNQPYSNHNGGQLAFGLDGYLYIALGDGGSGGDPQGNGQNRATLLGKILRIDVDRTEGPLPYAIPPDNPFAGNTSGFREEIFAYGLRNPWRFSIDSATGLIWAGDVGQGAREEVDIVVNGGNYGWRTMEGTQCYNPPSGCDTTGLMLPVWDYGRSLGSSITGGYVYRGSRRPELVGKYVFGDYVSGRVWAMTFDGGNPSTTQLLQTGFLLSSFGVDQSEELYLLNYAGTLHRFTSSPSTSVSGSDGLPAVVRLLHNYPNPFNSTTVIRYECSLESSVRLSVLDILGREVAVLVDGEVSPGSHSVSFDASGLSGGTYLYRLSTPHGVTARAMVLLK